MHSNTLLEFRSDEEKAGQKQSRSISEPGNEYVPFGHTMDRFAPPPGQKWSSLRNCTEARKAMNHVTMFYFGQGRTIFFWGALDPPGTLARFPENKKW